MLGVRRDDTILITQKEQQPALKKALEQIIGKLNKLRKGEDINTEKLEKNINCIETQFNKGKYLNTENTELLRRVQELDAVRLGGTPCSTPSVSAQ